jgi:hypothetical protein
MDSQDDGKAGRSPLSQLLDLLNTCIVLPFEPDIGVYLDAKHATQAIEAYVKAEVEKARFSPMGDNHHNAAKCPYCRPELAKQDQEALALRTENAQQAEEAEALRASIAEIRYQVERARDDPAHIVGLGWGYYDRIMNSVESAERAILAHQALPPGREGGAGG